MFKNDGDFINVDDKLYVLRIGEYFGYHYLPTQPFISEKSGILEIKKFKDYLINSDDIIYTLHFNDNYSKKLQDLVERKKIEDEKQILKSLINIPSIDIDEFTTKKNIHWKSIGGNMSSVVKTISEVSKIDFYFTFNHLNNKNYITFITKSKELILFKEDKISFLFADNTIINFILNENSYKSTKEISPIKNNIFFENKVIITNEELKIFQNFKFLKWKIYLSKNEISYIGGEEFVGTHISEKSNYVTKAHQQIVINKLATDFLQILKIECPQYIGIESKFDTELIVTSKINEECYVYLMIDLANNFHKIGISNNPNYREFTLQSEKPTIELIASKKFINRKIAKSFETALHNTFINKRLRGEWFQLDDNEINEIIYTLKN